MSVAGKSYIVTGARGQLGSAICTMLSNEGAVPYCVDIDDFDVTDDDSIARYFNALITRNVMIDGIVNNAGISTFDDDALSRTCHAFDDVMAVNVRGAYSMIKHYVMLYDAIGASQGAIVNVASVYGVVSPDFSVYTDCSRVSPEVYGASKAGLIQLTRYFAVYLASRSIRVNSVSPGGVLNIDDPQGADFVHRYSARCPMKRMAYAHEIAGPVLFLLSDHASYITGHNMLVDGGLTAW